MVTIKTRIKDVLFVCITILCLLLTGCKQVENRNLEADDAISEAIYAKFGDKIYYMRGQKDANNRQYIYMIHDYEVKDIIASVIAVFQEVMEEENIQENIRIFFTEEVSRSRCETVAFISNYMIEMEDSKTKQLDGMEYLCIYGTRESTHNDTSPYNEPSTYFNIEGIKYLEISEKINQIAEEEGVDWYEVFPELESFSVDE